MTYALGAALLAASLLLLWLIVTKRWQFPLLFDCGLALLVFGIAANGIQLATDSDPNLRAWLVAGTGAALMLASYFRESRRKPELGTINRRIMRGPR